MAKFKKGDVLANSTKQMQLEDGGVVEIEYETRVKSISKSYNKVEKLTELILYSENAIEETLQKSPILNSLSDPAEAHYFTITKVVEKLLEVVEQDDDVSISFKKRELDEFESTNEPVEAKDAEGN